MRIFCEASGQSELSQYRRGMWEAWHAAAFQRTKRMPDLAGLLRKMGGEPEKKQTVEEMIHVVECIVRSHETKQHVNGENK